MKELKEHSFSELLAKNSNVLAWKLDANFVFTYISSFVHKAIGYETDEIVGKYMLSFVTPESKDHILDQWEQRISKNELNKIIILAVQFTCKNGNKILVEVLVESIYNGNRIVGYNAILKDKY